MNASWPNNNPIGALSSGTGSTALRFGYPIGDPSGSPSDKITKYPSTFPITSPPSSPSETKTKVLYRVPNEFPSANTSNLLIEYSIRYPIGAPSTMLYDQPSSNTGSYPRSYPDALNIGRQDSQVRIQINIIIFILHVISY